MKKLLLSLALVGILISFSPIAYAQTVEPTQQELTQQLVVLLTQLIAQLQQQINDILAAQAATTQAINGLQQSNQQIAQNTSPVDVCLNMDGVQTYIPGGMTQDSNNDCIAPYQPTKEIRFINIPTSPIVFYSDLPGAQPTYPVSSPKYYSDNVLQYAGQNWPFPVNVVGTDGTNLKNAQSITIPEKDGTYTYTVTAPQFDPDAQGKFTLTFQSAPAVPPTISAIALPGQTGSWNNLIKLTFKSNSIGFSVSEMKYHIISNDIKDTSSNFHISRGNTNSDILTYNGIGDDFSPNMYIPNGGQVDTTFFAWGSQKGTFQVELDSVKWTMAGTTTTTDLSVLSPVITIQ